MLKTNSKKAKENLHRYIMEATRDHMEERAAYDGVPTPDTFPAVCREVLREFGEEARHLLKYPTIPTQTAFIQWGQGLPCGSLFDFHCGDAREMLGDILEETEEERERFGECQAEDLFSKLIFREVINGAAR